MSPMASSDALDTYLNDHLAGANAGVDLARRLESEGQGTAAAPYLAGLADDIEADRTTLQDLMDYLGVEAHSIKHAAGWAAEKLGRLKMNRTVAGSQELALLLMMEALSAGVEGKRNLWQALKVVATVDPAFDGIDLDTLLKRAADQSSRLEEARVAVAGPALVTVGSRAG